ncbi:MAG: hypothetical protein ACLUPM_08005, partial [Oscillibacter sp.]
MSTASLPAWFPRLPGGEQQIRHIKFNPFIFIQIAVDGESVRRRFSAPHQFAANAQEQIALRRMCRNEQAYFKGAGTWEMNGFSESSCLKTGWQCGKNRLPLPRRTGSAPKQYRFMRRGCRDWKNLCLPDRLYFTEKFAPHGLRFPAGGGPPPALPGPAGSRQWWFHLQRCPQDAIIRNTFHLSRIFWRTASFKSHRAMVRKTRDALSATYLSRRLEAVKDRKRMRADLLSLRAYYDLDSVTGLSGFDRRQVCVPKVCEKSCSLRNACRYHQYLKEARSAEIFVQICNHNYLLADAAHRLQEMRPLLNDYRALVIDEAHKLPDAARQMYGQSLSAEDFRELCDLLAKEKY